MGEWVTCAAYGVSTGQIVTTPNPLIVYLPYLVRAYEEGVYYHFPIPDHPMKLHNIGVPELAHDGSLLKELDPVLLQSRRFQCLDGHLHSPTGGLPHPLFHVPKLARTNRFCDPEGKGYK